MNPANIAKFKHKSRRPVSNSRSGRIVRALFPLPALILTATVAMSAIAGRAGDGPLDEDDFRVSYIYAAVMGTGTYEIDGRRITMLKMPFKWTQRHPEDQQVGLTWYAPITIGYDAVTDNNWLDRIFEEDLVTLTAMPGFEVQIPLGDTWTLKPLGNVGVTRDFTDEETIVMGVLGTRALATWRQDPAGRELRWGLGIRVAGEYQLDSGDSEAFFIFETGVDYRRDTGFSALERKINAGVYVRYQQFVPVWELTSTPLGDSEVPSLIELGLSVGLKRPRKIFGLQFERVRVGYQRGDGFTGWTLGSKFPF